MRTHYNIFGMVISMCYFKRLSECGPPHFSNIVQRIHPDNIKIITELKNFEEKKKPKKINRRANERQRKKQTHFPNGCWLIYCKCFCFYSLIESWFHIDLFFLSVFFVIFFYVCMYFEARLSAVENLTSRQLVLQMI